MNMRITVLIFLFIFTTQAQAFEYRHKEVKRGNISSFYITIGFVLPTKNTISGLSKIDVTNPNDLFLVPNGFEEMADDIILKKNVNFASKKIGGMMAFGYKTPYLLRTDLKIDFITFSRNYKTSTPQDPDTYGDSSTKIYQAYFTERQMGVIGSLYIDLDNSTIFTPYVGFGLGQTFNQLVTILEGTDESFSLKKKDLTSNIKTTYEISAGVLIGSRKAFVDISLFQRKTPKLEIVSKGIKLTASFAI
jgi:opacity protein-like surface antigen